MSNDRKVSTDALETLGTIIDNTQKRDAIHLAVIPVKAQEYLYPGDDVGADGTKESPVGIVDPFLKCQVTPDDMFWLVIYPRQINSLRHVWSHPSFPDEEQTNFSENFEKKSTEWIKNFAKESGLTFDQLMAAAINFLHEDKYFIFDNQKNPPVPEEFWYHYEIVTNHKISEKRKGNFFGCAC
jgi:hypothetical protein